MEKLHRVALCVSIAYAKFSAWTHENIPLLLCEIFLISEKGGEQTATFSRLFIANLAALAVLAALEPGIALVAAPDDWTKPAEGIIDTLRSGAVRLGRG